LSCLYQDALPIKTLQRYGFFANYQTFYRLFLNNFFPPFLAYIILYSGFGLYPSFGFSYRIHPKKIKIIATFGQIISQKQENQVSLRLVVM
jgi:hypothetical protein